MTAPERAAPGGETVTGSGGGRTTKVRVIGRWVKPGQPDEQTTISTWHEDGRWFAAHGDHEFALIESDTEEGALVEMANHFAGLLRLEVDNYFAARQALIAERDAARARVASIENEAAQLLASWPDPYSAGATTAMAVFVIALANRSLTPQPGEVTP